MTANRHRNFGVDCLGVLQAPALELPSYADLLSVGQRVQRSAFLRDLLSAACVRFSLSVDVTLDLKIVARVELSIVGSRRPPEGASVALLIS